MLIAAQFPLADLRPFLADATHRLLNPDWPTPRSFGDFMRLVGAVEERRRGGVWEWPDERMFCRAARAMRFEPTFSLGTRIGTRRRYGAFRRFFSDGQGSSRVEVGLAFRGAGPWMLEEFFAVLHAMVSLPIAIGPRRRAVSAALLNCAAPLARLALDATTSAKVKGFTPPSWWLTPCDPMLLVDYDTARAPLPRPPNFRPIDDHLVHGAELAYGRIRILGRPVGLWLLGTGPGTDPDYRRRLRIHLLRLHAEREIVKEVLRAIHTGKIAVRKTTPEDPPGDPSNRLQQFLFRTIGRMERKDYAGLPQSDLLRAVEEIQDSVTEGERTALLERMRPLRRIVLSAVERFTVGRGSAETVIVVEAGGRFEMTQNTQNVNISGTVAGSVTVNQLVAQTISNALNQVRQSQAPDEMKARLTELNGLVEQLVQKVPVETQEKAAKNLEALTKEATSTRPDPAWYKVSAEGLIEAAKTVAEMAAPITTAVRAVLALLV